MTDPDGTLDKKSQEDAIYIVNYNPTWPNLAKEEISTLTGIFPNEDWVVDIQHIGSTAVPGLAAKPIIDIYIGARSLEKLGLCRFRFEKSWIQRSRSAVKNNVYTCSPGPKVA